MIDFLRFRKFITPILIEIAFWLGSAAMVIFGIIAIATSSKMRYSYYGRGGETYVDTEQIVGGLFMIFLGPFLVRVYCELLILAFKGYGVLLGIQKTTEMQLMMAHGVNSQGMPMMAAPVQPAPSQVMYPQPTPPPQNPPIAPKE